MRAHYAAAAAGQRIDGLEESPPQQPGAVWRVEALSALEITLHREGAAAPPSWDETAAGGPSAPPVSWGAAFQPSAMGPGLADAEDLDEDEAAEAAARRDGAANAVVVLGVSAADDDDLGLADELDDDALEDDDLNDVYVDFDEDEDYFDEDEDEDEDEDWDEEDHEDDDDNSAHPEAKLNGVDSPVL